MDGKWIQNKMHLGDSSNSFLLPSSTSDKKNESAIMDICSICMSAMKIGDGRAMFTAECSHIFHFICIASNVKHGNYTCPICRAKWKETLIKDFSNPLCFETYDSIVEDMRDDAAEGAKTLEIKICPEYSAIAHLLTQKEFNILIHLVAPTRTCRAPLDLVTVLDVSGSMEGRKLNLLKQAMRFVIQNLQPHDRLSIVSFSCHAHRLLNLHHMSEHGKQRALEVVDFLSSGGGTNIIEGLKMGIQVIDMRRMRNPVCNMMFLSDGQDNYTFSCTPKHIDGLGIDYKSYLSFASENRIPIHTFGLGSDHDAALLNAISEVSGGTFSFIEDESVVQDAFAQCIGGLLSVIAQELHICFDCVHPGVQISSVKSGIYFNNIAVDKRSGFINACDMYAEEERDFLVSVDVPATSNILEEMTLMNVNCDYKDPTLREATKLDIVEAKIGRPDIVLESTLSIDVDRQRNRFKATEAMAKAKALAEKGNLREAVTTLETCKATLVKSLSGVSGDMLCLELIADIQELQERMSDERKYISSGHAYTLSSLTAHTSQRATARGSSMFRVALRSSAAPAAPYQTTAMSTMIRKSQEMGEHDQTLRRKTK